VIREPLRYCLAAMRTIKTLLISSALIATTAVVAACGGVPSDSVATISDSPILKTQFNHWMDVASKTQGGATGATFIYSPPDFDQCIATKTAEAKKGATKAAPAPSAAQIKTLCKSQFDQTMPQVMQLLISSAWIRGEAASMGISVTDAEINKKFEQTKKGAFPTEKAFQDFLKQSGETKADLLDRVRSDALAQKIREKVIKDKGTATDAQIKAFYDKNQAQYGTPEKRDVSLILTKSEADANAAKAAVASGTSWADAAKKYSTDAATKNSGGVVKGATKGQQDPAVDKAAFAAKPGVVVGPVKGAFGWYIVDVSNVKAANLTPLEKVKKQISQQVIAANQQAALAAFVKDFQARWKSRTECAQYYVVELCNNAPKQKAAPAQPGGATQQAPPAGG